MGVYSKANRPIHISDYDVNWPHLYEEEKNRILSVLPEWDVLIEHIGSTSIRQLASKPIIDIAIGISSLANVTPFITALEDLEYTYEPEFEQEIPNRRFLWKGLPLHRTHHVSIMESDSEIWHNNIRFRDYLRSNKEDAKRYADLKRQLASDCVDDIERYIKGKTEFVKSILWKAHTVNRDSV